MDRLRDRGSGDHGRATLVVSLAVGAHLLAGIAHGVVHEVIPVHLPWWQTAIVATAGFAGPMVGAALVATGRRRAGGALVAASLTVAFGFELFAHFLVPNPDHVGAVSTHGVAFTVTALLTIATDAIGALVGAWCWRSR